MNENKFRIESIEISGFRGFGKSQKFDLKGKSAFLLGSVGTGKTSTLWAIEWCLFGDLAYFKSPESKTGEELINTEGSEDCATVILRLGNGGSMFEAKRTKYLKGRGSDFVVRYQGNEFEGEKAEEAVFNVLGLSFDDFHTSVYLHQEAIRGLLVEDPKQRDEALDRLFGLERIRDIVGHIPVNDAKKTREELEFKKSKLTGQIQGATKIIESNLEIKKKDASVLGLTDEQITINFAKNFAEKLGMELNSVAQENNLEQLEKIDIDSAKAIKSFIRKANDVIKNYRVKIVDTTNLDILNKKQRDLTKIKDQLGEQISSLKEIDNKVDTLIKEGGEEDVLTQKIELEKDKITALQNERSQQDTLSQLISDSIAYFKISKPDRCPVCNSQIDATSVLDRLATKSNIITEDIDNKIKSSKKTLESLNDKLEDLKSFKGKKENIETQLSAILRNASDNLGFSVKIEDAQGKINDELQTLKPKIEGANTVYHEKMAKADNFENSLSKLKAIEEVLEMEEQFNSINQSFSDERASIATLDENITNLANYEQRLRNIVVALSSIQQGLASSSINKGIEEINDFYSSLMAHPYYQILEISVSSKNVSGVKKNTYAIQAKNTDYGRNTFVVARFSTGQMNCVAISVFLALSNLAEHNLGFIMLDDPTQSLDEERKLAFANTIKKVTEERQVIIASQDDLFINTVQDQYKGNEDAMILQFKEWNTKGPLIQLAV
ncbi:MAG: SMC family ATPase [Nitrososphaerota archaeon]|jgi:DNA repair exonuclease SbcCD ATPase subunit|nr:SMC family ATPase [Nitrososphaerota archaeon]